jgi:3-methyladenine DNA glycosylase/8-oxoguanine DNA glycosylase
MDDRADDAGADFAVGVGADVREEPGPQAGQETTWRPGRPVPLRTILGTLRRGPGDATTAERDGVLWRGQQTPCGPASVAIEVLPAAGEVRARAWGPGAEWALAWLPSSLGADDDPTGFEAPAPLRHVDRLHPHWRVPRTGLVFEATVAAALEQKVTGQEAWLGWRRLVNRFGEPAPGPAGAWGLRVLPAPAVVRRIPSWEWLRMSVDGARSRVVVRAAVQHEGLQRTLDLVPDDADRALRSLPGVGVWTSAEVRQRSHGHADAVSFGDYHVPASVGVALTGQPVDDAGMAELLEEYRPHRYRVQRLVELGRIRKERHGARMAPRRHLPGSR